VGDSIRCRDSIEVPFLEEEQKSQGTSFAVDVPRFVKSAGAKVVSEFGSFILLL